MKRFLISIAIFSFLTGCLSAQELKLTASASPAVMRVGDQFNLTFTSEDEVAELELPGIENIEILGGPRQGHSQSVTSINGKITSSSTYQYTYFLRALKEGKFSIPAITAKIKNKPVRSNAVAIEVLAANSQQSRPGQSASGAGQSGAGQSGSGSVSDRDLFVNLLVDKKEVYLGEQITASVKIYTKVNLSGVDPTFKGPDFTGFFTEPINIPQLRSLQSEAYNGDIYGTGVLRKTIIIPQKTGPITIKSFDLEVTMRKEVRRRVSDPFFDDFDIPDVQEIPIKLNSKEVTVQVKPLPGNAPASFGGAVGNFTFSSSLNKTSTQTNEPVTLKLTISGRGNIKLINEPQFELPGDFEKFDPVINSHLDNSLSGIKTFEYLLMPKAPGTYSIPSVEFSYFDLASLHYKTIKSQAFTVKVEKGQGDAAMDANSGITKEDVKLLNQDIRFIKNKPIPLQANKTFWADSVWYYLNYLLLIVLFILLTWRRRKQLRNKADVSLMRLRKADRYARKRLTKSAELLKQGDTNRFYEELLGAVWGYLSDKLNIPHSALSRETARNALHSRAIDENLMDDLIRIIDECEVARYGQVSENMGMEKLYQDTLNVITMLQQKLK
jgi:hypothetical protein